MHSREHNQATRLGALLNELADINADAARLPARLEPGDRRHRRGLVGVNRNDQHVRRNDGPMGKSDRALVQGAAATWVALGREANEVMAPLMALLLLATVYKRARHILAKEE